LILQVDATTIHTCSLLRRVIIRSASDQFYKSLEIIGRVETDPHFAAGVSILHDLNVRLEVSAQSIRDHTNLRRHGLFRQTGSNVSSDRFFLPSKTLHIADGQLLAEDAARDLHHGRRRRQTQQCARMASGQLSGRDERLYFRR
jgi:hypothetical protein